MRFSPLQNSARFFLPLMMVGSQISNTSRYHFTRCYWANPIGSCFSLPYERIGNEFCGKRRPSQEPDGERNWELPHRVCLTACLGSNRKNRQVTSSTCRLIVAQLKRGQTWTYQKSRIKI